MNCSNRNIVEQAKPHGSLCQGMMSGRANQAEGIRITAFEDVVNRIDHGSRSQASDLVRPLAYDRIGVQCATSRFTKCLYLLLVSRWMNTL